MKVAYSVTKYLKNNIYKLKGIGELENGDLTLKNGKVLEDVERYCHKIADKVNEFTGYYEEYEEIDVENKYGSYTTIEVLNNYRVWFKKI